MRKILAIALSIIVSTTITITSTGIAKVYAETTSEQPDIELIERICSTGVSEETAYRLAQKVEAGGMLDSMNPQYKDMAPTFEVLTEERYEAIYVYPDGSVNTVRAIPEIITGTVTGGNFQGGSYWYSWTNAHAIASWGVVTAGFYANLQGGSGGKITDVWQPGITVFGGTFADQSLWIQNNQASAGSPAEAVLYFVGTAVESFGSSTFYLRLYVGMSGMPYARFSIF